jgi:hypothetical protein
MLLFQKIPHPLSTINHAKLSHFLKREKKKKLMCENYLTNALMLSLQGGWLSVESSDVYTWDNKMYCIPLPFQFIISLFVFIVKDYILIFNV